MPTSRLGLPTITGNMTNDVVRDLNALAEAVDEKVAPKNATDNLATKEELINHVGESASPTKKGHVQLSSSTNSTSEVLAATPKAVKEVKDSFSNVKNYDVATQMEAETGTSDLKYMTPLKVKQAVTKFTPKNVPGGFAELDSNGNVINANGSIPGGWTRYVNIDFSVTPSLEVFVDITKYKMILIEYQLENTTGLSNMSSRVEGYKTGVLTLGTMTPNSYFQQGQQENTMVEIFNLGSMIHARSTKRTGSGTIVASESMGAWGVLVDSVKLTLVEINSTPKLMNKGNLIVWGRI